MSVLVSVVGGNPDSDEYRAALKLKNIIQESVPQSVIGEVVLFASANLVGQTVKDVDLFMLGTIQNYELSLEFIGDDDEYIKDKVSINSFCTTIEVKSHGIDAISRIGTDFYVKYGKTNHCVTEQSNNQKTSAMNFFKRILSFSPFITNLIWFTETTKEDLKDLLKVESKEMPANVLGRDFKFAELIQLLVWQRKPYHAGKIYKFDSHYGNCSVSDLQKALDMFTRVKSTMGELTRQRIEMISRKAIAVDSIIPQNGKMPICRGRAGTGKTIALIQTAIKLVDEEYARVLLLTYNKALVSDIRRLFALSELPDLFEETCVHVSTMHSFYYRLINMCLYDGKLDGKTFINEYEKYLSELTEFIESDTDAIQCIKDITIRDSYLNWEYVLVDEAQDWTEKEQHLLTLLYKNDHIIVADGGKQFVRNVDACDWSTIQNRENIKFKQCLRQKNNLVKFVNRFFAKYSGMAKNITSSDKLPGGKVLIINDKEQFFSTIKDELKATMDIGNIAYDMLFLVPHSMVDKTQKDNFIFTSQFEDNGIFLWDGTNESVRESYTVQADEVRILQYDSARGLEGWCVCCMDLDQMIEEKSREYHGKSNPLLLQSKEEDMKMYIENWIMISLTRAIDTLIITLKNPLSEEAKVLKALADECSDYITWI